MMDLQKASRTEWNCVREDVADGEINMGSLQRIASACELIAKSHEDLAADLEWHKAAYEDQQKELKHHRAVIKGLKGRITILKGMI